jgi:cytochrome b561
MDLKSEANDYGTLVRTLHWLGALCVVGAWLIGTFIDDLPKSLGPRAMFVHMSFGLTILALLLLRVGWRFARPVPALATRLGPSLEFAARAMQWVLYALMLAVPIAGIVLEFARGQPLPLFGIAEIASPWVRDRAFSRTVMGVHGWAADALLLLATLHAAAALFHHFVLKDRTLLRMLPGHR